MSDKKPVPPSLAQFAIEQLAEAGEQAAIDLTVQNVEILRAEIERRDARIVELEAHVTRLGRPYVEMRAQLEREWCQVREMSDALKNYQPSAGVAQGIDIDAAAKAMAQCMDYPWDFMPERGREAMRDHAKSVIDAALQVKP